MRMLPVAAVVLSAAVLVAPATRAHAQVAPAPPPPLEVGAAAPDFVLPGATRFGVLQQPVRLSDYRGKTVVLAFFYRARTRG
jgi:cytochrome oxidase Cu insertion factor (SCO1/SenC/PrrC family)